LGNHGTYVSTWYPASLVRLHGFHVHKTFSDFSQVSGVAPDVGRDHEPPIEPAFIGWDSHFKFGCRLRIGGRFHFNRARTDRPGRRSLDRRLQSARRARPVSEAQLILERLSRAGLGLVRIEGNPVVIHSHSRIGLVDDASPSLMDFY